MNSFELHQGDCLETLRGMADNSVDSIVTDPPYGLSFMGKKWDYDVPGVDVWTECLRVLKPGGHLLAFAGTRTQHRMAVRIEDAGFEIRDMIAWVYGSGFPKSLDVSKAIDKAAGAEREVVGVREDFAARANKARKGVSWADNTVADGSFSNPDQIGTITAPATEAARQWQGFGTSLKPALEPITVARKPLTGTVAANVLEWGTGALNIDGCRVGTNGEVTGGSGGRTVNLPENVGAAIVVGRSGGNGGNVTPDAGRWPANLIHDGSDEVLAGFPVTTSGTKVGGQYARSTGVHEGGQRADGAACYGDTGSAARFFYCAKASKRDRDEGLEGFEAKAAPKLSGGEWVNPNGNGLGNQTIQRANIHPTVKPTDLMVYLCRLVTPPGGIVLDPFMGSGSTGKAAMREGFRFIGCELSPEYLAIAQARIEHELARVTAANAPPAPAPQPDLFAV